MSFAAAVIWLERYELGQARLRPIPMSTAGERQHDQQLEQREDREGWRALRACIGFLAWARTISTVCPWNRGVPTSGSADWTSGWKDVRFCQKAGDVIRVTFPVVSGGISVYKNKTDYPYSQTTPETKHVRTHPAPAPDSEDDPGFARR
jgi:hypothetical protein